MGEHLLRTCSDLEAFCEKAVLSFSNSVVLDARLTVLRDSEGPGESGSGRAQGEGPKGTDGAQNADLPRTLQAFADSPLFLEIPALGGRKESAQECPQYCWEFHDQL